MVTPLLHICAVPACSSTQPSTSVRSRTFSRSSPSLALLGMKTPLEGQMGQMNELTMLAHSCIINHSSHHRCLCLWRYPLHTKHTEYSLYAAFSSLEGKQHSHFWVLGGRATRQRNTTSQYSQLKPSKMHNIFQTFHARRQLKIFCF